MAYKVFTNGSVLNASEVNDNLMNQAVITFTNSTARGSAITTPVEGMLTYLEDTNAYEYWDGAAWTNLVSSSSGLDFITAQDFTGVTSVSLGSDASPVFSSTYDVYKIIIFAEASTNTNRTISLRLRANTTDNTAANYSTYNQGLDFGGTAVNSTSNAQTSGVLLSNLYYLGYPTPIEFDIYFPFLAENTMWQGMAHGGTAAVNFAQRIGGLHSVASSFNGFTLINSAGNFQNSRVMVYGYRRA